MKAQIYEMKTKGATAHSGPLKTDVARLFAAPIGRLLGIEVTADIYARNGFRLLGVAAGAEPQHVESESQKFRNIYKLNPAKALGAALRIGYDAHLEFGEIPSHLARLGEPRHRTVCELFGLHLPPALFNAVREDRHLASPRVVQTLTEAAGKTNGIDGALVQHALAIAHHNLALAQELAFAAGGREWSGEHWNKALFYWTAVARSDSFWEYFRQRMQRADDPRLKPEDATLLRQQLPGVILGFNTLFARAYAKAEASAACARHLSLITQSQLPDAVKHESVAALVKILAVGRLEPLIQRVTAELMEVAGHLSRENFNKVCGPVLQDALAARHYLLSDLRLAKETVEMAEFDRLCELVLKALDLKINYRGDDWSRNVLYNLLILQKLTALPISPAMRRKLEQSIRRDTESLYGEFKPAGDMDATQCWFLADEMADPDASLELPVYKITAVEGATVKWNTRKILVPRSALAAKFHQGQVKITDIAKTREDEKSRALQREIEATRAQCENAVATIQKNRDQAIQAQTAQLQEKLTQYNNQAAGEEAQAKKDLARIAAHLQENIAAEQSRGQQTREAARKKAAAPMAQAEADYKQAVAANAGWRGASRLELPIIGAVLLAMAIMAIILPRFGATAINLPFDKKIFIIGLISVAGVMVGRLIRHKHVEKAGAPVAQLKQMLDRELAQLNRAGKKAVDELKKWAEKAASESKNRLASIEAQRGKIKKEYDNQIAALQRQAETEMKSLRDGANKKIQSLEKMLQDRLNPKTAAATKDFPPYKNAKAQGFSDGDKPSDYEVNRLAQREFENFMASLTYEDRTALALLGQAMGQDKLSALIDNLMKMSPAERREKLRLLRTFGSFGGYRPSW